MATQITRPTEAEYPPFFRQYIHHVQGDDLAVTLKAPMAQSLAIWHTFPQDRELYTYAEGKWTPREILGHIIDTERIMQYRALAIARGEKQSLPGFDENSYVKNAQYNDRPLATLFAEFTVVRLATQLLFQQSINDTDLLRTGTANGRAITSRAIAWIIFGHELHHIALLKERYLTT